MKLNKRELLILANALRELRDQSGAGDDHSIEEINTLLWKIEEEQDYMGGEE